MVAGATEAAELGLAGPARPEVPDEGREVAEMRGWDLGAGRQVLKAVRRKRPHRGTPEDLSDSSLLGAGEHGAAIVVEPPCMGQSRDCETGAHPSRHTVGRFRSWL